MRYLLIGLTAATLAAGGGDEEKARKEIRGIWLGVGAETAGKKVPLLSSWEFKDDTIVESFPRGKSEWKYRLDPAKNPKAIDLTPGTGPAAGKTLKGIYAIDKDMLKICYVAVKAKDPDKRERPADFVTKKGDELVTLTFRRTK
jgi:uncharacterized protein (TIGR03067 family)